MIKTFFLISGLYFLFGCNNSESIQTNAHNEDFYEKCRRLVIDEKRIGQEYFFSRIVKGVDEISITYLGNIITAKADTLRILNSINYTGQLASSKRGNGNVFIYNTNGERVGFYYVGGAWAVPSKIENESLIFNYANENCNQSTIISLKDSIPQHIFIKCTEKGGDLYDFSKE